MKEIYSKPLSEIERFSVVDILTQSTEDGQVGLGYFSDSNYFAD